MLGISWFQLAGAVYLSQFPSCVRFTPGGEEAVVTLFLTVIAVRITTGLLLRNCLLGGKVSARIVPRGAVGIGLFSIDLWLASPFRLLPKPSSGSGRSSVIRFLVDLFGIAVSGGVFVVPLYALLAGG